MKNQKRELIFLRTFAVSVGIGIFAFMSFAFKNGNPFNQKFGTIDVERINIVENDGTVKMVITNVENFPVSGDTINGNNNHDRKKRAGMLFFNEDGIECGGFIYDGAKNERGHSAGLSLTYDQYNGDQVMQLLSTDSEVDGDRRKYNSLVFNDRSDSESQEELRRLSAELSAIKDPELKRKRYKELKEQGHFSSVRRVALGQFPGNQNGLFLFDEKGNPRAKFCVDHNNEVKLLAFDEKGNTVGSWPN
ncbi:hypothetical protein [Aureivirga sp. CE67]|uniref:hypothetical protein n=1 Tax=Aureivirga sp. CE67 TaxID=1788983 RepID=UPI0018CAB829|nr:hypothetical protein [Aureivirga sp. CE67]